MRGPRKKLADEEQLYQAALGALMRRAYSIWEMRKYLEERAEEKPAVRSVLDRLKQQGYLDDARYAAQFARFHAETRKQGRFRIARELRTRGVPDRHIEAALDAVFAEADEAAAVRARIERKLRSLRGPMDSKRLASLYRSLLRAGFSADIIRAELRARTKADVETLAADLPDDSE
jgi:regulatory protein